MRHEWIVDVLADLLAYTRENGFDDLSEQVAFTLAMAERDLRAAQGPGADAPEQPHPLLLNTLRGRRPN